MSKLARVAVGKTKWQMVMTDDLHERLKAQAVAESRTATDIVTELITRYLDRKRSYAARS